MAGNWDEVFTSKYARLFQDFSADFRPLNNATEKQRL